MADVGKQIKEGRHVGLDIYDLLIEAPECRLLLFVQLCRSLLA